MESADDLDQPTIAQVGALKRSTPKFERTKTLLAHILKH
jgi:hypothetical protein